MSALPDHLEGAVGRSWQERLLWLFAVALPLGTMVQFLLPVGHAGLAVTVSDMVAAVALLPMLIWALGGWRPRVECLVPRLWLWLGLMTTVLALGFLVGYARIGFQPWGATRILGWLVLMGHVAAAAWIASDATARRVALRVFLIGAAACAGFELLTTVKEWVFSFKEDCWAARAFGLTQNPNAFGFVLLIASAVALGEIRRGLFGNRTAEDVVIVLLTVGIGLTASRSAWLSLLLVAGVAFAFGWTRRLQAGVDLSVGVAIIVVLFAVLVCGKASAVSDGAKAVVSAVSEAKLDPTNVERFYTWRRSLELFFAHPFLGAGFGAFLDAELARGSTPLIIHSTFLWLLGEGGLVAAAVYVAFGAAVAMALVGHIRRGAADIRDDAVTAFLVMSAFAIMSMAQELLYQRCLWVVLALLIFRPAPADRSRAAA